jgi:hypothetical protein
MNYGLQVCLHARSRVLCTDHLTAFVMYGEVYN